MVKPNWCQSVGKMPLVATVVPGQISVAVGMPAFSAATQIGTDSFHHQASVPPTQKSGERFGSVMVLPTIPLRSGLSPVAMAW